MRLFRYFSVSVKPVPIFRGRECVLWPWFLELPAIRPFMSSVDVLGMFWNLKIFKIVILFFGNCD